MLLGDGGDDGGSYVCCGSNGGGAVIITMMIMAVGAEKAAKALYIMVEMAAVIRQWLWRAMLHGLISNSLWQQCKVCFARALRCDHLFTHTRAHGKEGHSCLGIDLVGFIQFLP